MNRLFSKLFNIKEYYVYKLPLDWHFSLSNFIKENRFQYVKINPAIINTFFLKDKYLNKTFHKFLNKKYIGYILLDESEWINYIWCATPNTPPPLHLTKLKKMENLYWIFFCRTNEVYQNKGFYSKCLQLFCNELLKSFNTSPESIYIDAGSSSISANKAMINSGFIRNGEIKIIRLFIPPLINIKLVNWKTE